MTMTRLAVKQLVEAVAGSRPAFAVARHRLRGARLVLAYHNVVDDATMAHPGDAALHLPFDSFKCQLDAIEDFGLEVVRVDASAPAPRSRPQVAISFDDAYCGALELAIPELARRGLPATIFVAPGILGRSSMWWDALATPRALAVPTDARDASLEEFAGDTDLIFGAAASRGWSLHPASASQRIGTERDIAVAMESHNGLTLGAHSWSHANLTRVSAERLRRELHETLRWLKAHWNGRAIDWLAYPYGLTSPDVQETAADVGYSGGLLVAGGWHRPDTVNRLAIPRYNVTAGLSTAGFRARLAGLL